MDSDSFWGRVRRAYEAGLDAGAGEAEAAVRAAAGGDAAVRNEATALLALATDGFLDRGLLLPALPDLLRPGLAAGTVVDGYRIVRLLGRGGMGEVHEAVRVGENFERRVALKVLRAGLVSPDLVRRFERERRILAGLEHPNIAALTDGGILPDGRPYLVMEFVDGAPITAWCRDRHVGIEERIRLFLQVCRAVDHAHRHLVVHRDIKPGNVLVTSDGSVKLLDFGIAKVIESDEGGDPQDASRTGMAALTPEYAAPEQLTGATVTTSTDIYALGVLLHELLTGARPYARAGRPLAELTRLVLTTEPPLPSQVASPPLARRLRGDLDAIVHRALRPSPTDRYPGADRLADDLRRHLARLPVEAMRGHRGYRMRRFAARHRGALATAGVILVALTTGAVATWRESRATRVQRDRAEATTRFLTDMLASVDPNAAGREVPMVEVLDSAAARIRTDTLLDPEVEATLEAAIGASYRALGKYDLAEPHLRRVVALRQTHPRDRTALAWSHRELGQLFDSRGEYAAADSEYRGAMELLQGSGDPAAADQVTDLLMQRARIQSLGGNLPAADSELTVVVARQRSAHGDTALVLATALSQLGVTLAQEYRFDSAATVTREALAIMQAKLPPGYPDVGKVVGRLATILEQSGHPAEADSAYRESLHTLDAALGPEHPDVAWIRVNYAGFLLDNRQWDRAIAEADTVLVARGKGLPDSHPGVALAIQQRGLALAGRGDHAAAVGAMRQSLALRRANLPSDHWMIGSSESLLGEELLKGGSRSEALALLRHGCRLILDALGPDHPVTARARERLAAVGDSVSCAAPGRPAPLSTGR